MTDSGQPDSPTGMERVHAHTASEPILAVSNASVSTDPKGGSWPVRLWLRTPEWVFRVAGGTFFFGLLAWRARVYFEKGFWSAGYYWQFSKRSAEQSALAPLLSDNVLYLPWARVLVDITFLLIALAFVFRAPARRRSSRPGEIWIPLVGAFWPFLPFAIHFVLEMAGSPRATLLDRMMLDRSLGLGAFLLGFAMVAAGNALDVWSYAVLFRSVSITAEARELKTTGPYRFIRHPVYLGQMVAQAGVWLVIAQGHWIWWAFYACFVAMQLYRARVEERVLEDSFGEAYRRYRLNTWWFPVGGRQAAGKC